MSEKSTSTTCYNTEGMNNSKLSDFLKEQEQLISELKDKYPKLYKWFVDRRIDLTDLNKHWAGISAAITIATATVQPASAPTMPEPAKTEIRVIQKSELKGLNDDERARLVWERYGPLIHKSARTYDLDPNLIFATIMIESGGDTNAIRNEPRINDASYGLGQILYGTARGIGFRGQPSELFDPETNIDLIGKYHRRNLDHYKNLTPQELTTAYNTGSPYKKALPGHINKFNKWYNRAANIEPDLS